MFSINFYLQRLCMLWAFLLCQNINNHRHIDVPQTPLLKHQKLWCRVYRLLFCIVLVVLWDRSFSVFMWHVLLVNCKTHNPFPLFLFPIHNPWAVHQLHMQLYNDGKPLMLLIHLFIHSCVSLFKDFRSNHMTLSSSSWWLKPGTD